MAVALLAVGFGVGLYASDHVGSSEPATTTTASPPAVATTAATTAPPPTTAPPQPAVEKARPVFSVAPLPRSLRTKLRGEFWHPGCPVPLSGLRLLTVSYTGFDRQLHTGEIVVNSAAAQPLERVFKKLYRQHFPIRHVSSRPGEGDATASFECRQAVPSPCTGGLKSGHWSMHAYGLAVDLNPTENPYIGCGESRDPATKPYRDRSRHRRGMVDDRVIAAFQSIGWGWGGSWTGDTKDYMHFSSTGH
jgi:hypothetical protein